MHSKPFVRNGLPVKVYFADLSDPDVKTMTTKINELGGLLVSTPDDDTMVLCRGSPAVEKSLTRYCVGWLYQCIRWSRYIDPEAYILPPVNAAPARAGKKEEVHLEESRFDEPPQAEEIVSSDEQNFVAEEAVVKDWRAGDFNVSQEEPPSVVLAVADVHEEPKRELATLERVEKTQTEASEQKCQPPMVWRGSIYWEDVANFFSTATQIDGTSPDIVHVLPDAIQIVGSINCAAGWGRLRRLQDADKVDLEVIQFTIAGDDKTNGYTALYKYLLMKNQLAIVNIIADDMRDFYITSRSSEDTVLPALLGIIVKDRRERPLVTSVISAVPGSTLETDCQEVSLDLVHSGEPSGGASSTPIAPHPLREASVTLPGVDSSSSRPEPEVQRDARFSLPQNQTQLMYDVSVRLERIDQFVNTSVSSQAASKLPREQPTPTASSPRAAEPAPSVSPDRCPSPAAVGGGVRRSTRRTSARVPVSGCREFSEVEERRMIKFLVKNNAVPESMQKSIWRKMKKEKILRKRSADELHEHFTSVLVNSYKKYVKDSKTLNLFCKLREKPQPQSTGPAKRQHYKYTEKENQTIVQFMIDNQYYDNTRRNEIWKKLGDSKLIPNHTVNSVNSHFNNTLKRKLKAYIKDPEILKQFKTPQPRR